MERIEWLDNKNSDLQNINKKELYRFFYHKVLMVLLERLSTCERCEEEHKWFKDSVDVEFALLQKFKENGLIVY